jgi:hypothetical protein
MTRTTGPSKTSESPGASKAFKASAKNIGLQPFKLRYSGPVSDTSTNVNETLLFVVPSTSGLVTQYQVRITSHFYNFACLTFLQLPAKVKFFAQLKSLVDQPPLELDTSEMKCITVPHDPMHNL